MTRAASTLVIVPESIFPMTSPILRRENVWMLSTAISESFLRTVRSSWLDRYAHVGHSQEVTRNQCDGYELRTSRKLTLNDERWARLTEISR